MFMPGRVDGRPNSTSCIESTLLLENAVPEGITLIMNTADDTCDAFS